MSKPVGPYTPAMHAGDFLMISGQIGHVDGTLVDGGLDVEAPKALENLKKLLELEGVSLNQVVKTTVFLTDMDDYVRMNEIYCAFNGLSSVDEIFVCNKHISKIRIIYVI